MQQKQVIAQLFVEGIYIFHTTSYRKLDQRIKDFFFFLRYGNKCLFVIINFLKDCSEKLGYSWLILNIDITILIVMPITFLTMYNKNHLFDKKHMGTKRYKSKYFTGKN